MLQNLLQIQRHAIPPVSKGAGWTTVGGKTKWKPCLGEDESSGGNAEIFVGADTTTLQ